MVRYTLPSEAKDENLTKPEIKKMYTVKIKDVDGNETRNYKTYEKAAAKFLEVSGYNLPLGHKNYETVSNFGTVVIFNTDQDVPVYRDPVENNEKFDEEGYRIQDDIQCVNSYETYGSVDHQAFGDAWFYRDCAGAW